MEFTSSMAVVLVIGLFIITFNLQAFEIPSSSMEDTLLIGDHVFVDRVTYAPKANWLGPAVPYREIRRGDIVVFLSVTDPGMYIVKRIVGIPGDRIRLRDGEVYRNGEKLDEPYKKTVCDDRQTPCYSPYRDNFPSVPPLQSAVPPTPEWSLLMPLNKGPDDELVVPKESYFAMGDNRFASYDSRYWGFIPRENVIGRPMFIYWSFETPRDQYTKQTFRERIAFIGHVVLHFFDETRWRRTLRMVR
ncbi:MAG: signal peptidase I [Candidatus Koribacter versatilis]|uniref:Signal peptidase I n=1 Tax=Candidatus Korobacter versatilis TaxID=658062 RepID=A0A932A9Y6_9BACT|nr:signal peptidase I [Candidatus Koribacter versatilis]